MNQNTQSRKLIVRAVRREFEAARNRYQDAEINLAEVTAARKVWEKHNPDDGVGGMSTNPYNPKHAEGRVQMTKDFLGDIEAAYNLAVDTFLEGDDDSATNG